MSGPVWLVAGHRPGSPGARTADGVTEHAWCSAVVDAIAGELADAGIPAVVDVRSDSLGYEAAMRAMATRAKQAGAVCLLEVHFNSAEVKPGYAAPARTEVLHWPGSVRGESLAMVLAGHIDAAIRPHHPTRQSWRVIAQDRSWSSAGQDASGRPIPTGAPLYALSLPACPAVIVESHFGNSPKDHAAADKALASGELARAVVAAIRQWRA